MAREFISPEGLRLDGRRPKEVRKIECKLGVLSGVDGSAVFQQGNTKVIASVYGPREVMSPWEGGGYRQHIISQAKFRGDMLYDRATVSAEYSLTTFSASERKKVNKADRRSAEISMLLRSTFESVILTHLFPRSQIHIFVQVLLGDGGERSAAVNAASLALINAGIPMYCMLCACSGGLIDSTPLVDLNLQERAGGPELVVAADPGSKKLYLVQLDSKLALDRLAEVSALAVEACCQISKELEQAVKDYTLSRAPAQM